MLTWVSALWYNRVMPIKAEWRSGLSRHHHKVENAGSNPCLRNHNKIDASYVAGYFDADGSVGYYRYQHNKRYNYCRLEVKITSVNKEMMEKIESFSGFKWNWYVREAKGNSRETFTINCSFHKAKTFLEQVIPFLHLKRDVAKRCLEAFYSKSREPIKNKPT